MWLTEDKFWDLLYIIKTINKNIRVTKRIESLVRIALLTRLFLEHATKSMSFYDSSHYSFFLSFYIMSVGRWFDRFREGQSLACLHYHRNE